MRRLIITYTDGKYITIDRKHIPSVAEINVESKMSYFTDNVSYKVHIKIIGYTETIYRDGVEIKDVILQYENRVTPIIAQNPKMKFIKDRLEIWHKNAKILKSLDIISEIRESFTLITSNLPGDNEYSELELVINRRGNSVYRTLVLGDDFKFLVGPKNDSGYSDIYIHVYNGICQWDAMDIGKIDGIFSLKLMTNCEWKKVINPKSYDGSGVIILGRIKL